MSARTAKLDPERLDLAVDRCFEAAFRPQEWTRAFDEIALAAGATGLIAFTFGGRDRDAFLASVGCAVAMDEYLGSSWPARNPRLTKPPGENICTDRDFAEGPMRAFREDFLRRYDMGWFAGTSLFRARERQVVMSLERSWRHGAYEAPAMASIARAFERMRRAIMLSTGFDDRLGHAAETGFEAWQRPTIVLGCDAVVLHVNASAERLMIDAIGLHAGRLVAENSDDRSALSGLAGRLCRPGRPAERADEAPVIVRGTRRTILVKGAPLPPTMGGFFARARALLFLSAVEAPAAPEPRLLRSAFGLTPAEARVARALLQAGDLARAAQMEKIGHETARSHMKAIFAKAGVNSQVALAALLGSLRTSA